MSKKHAFLQFFAKITIFACVFCAVPAWSETTCDIDYTPVTGNSWQTGNPTPTNPVAIESIGTKVGNKYQVSITAQGKNLFDKTLEFNRGYISTDGSKGGTASSALMWNTYPIEVKPNTTYTLINPDYGSTGTKNISLTSQANINYLQDQSSFVGRGWSGQDMSVVTFTTTAETHGVLLTLTYKQDLSKVMLVEGSTAPASYEPYSAPITTPIYLNAPLRKVGDYADVLDYKNGTITRNVGVKVLDGTNATFIKAADNKFYPTNGSDWAIEYRDIVADHNKVYIMSNQFSSHTWNQDATASSGWSVSFRKDGVYSYIRFLTTGISTVEGFNAFLAEQYAAGTPVIVYYPLATPVVEQIENWSCNPSISGIKIATTKYVDDEFAPLNTALANAISVVDNVVTQTIAQAGQIATLQNTKQTRPDDDNECPAGKKCLLVTDESGTPHWYPIIEP